MLKVVTWNQRKSFNAMAEIQFAGPQYDIIATQEMGLNKATSAPFCPANGPYKMVWAPESRAAIFLHKKHDLRNWTMKCGKDWASVSVPFEKSTISFVSVYVEQPVFGRPWQSALDELRKKGKPEGQVVLMGDVNLHSPIWDVWDRCSRGVETLLDLGASWRLHLLTPRGEPTRTGVHTGNRQERDSTIDHIWVSKSLTARYAGALPASGSDHHPQVAEITLEGLKELDSVTLGYRWKELNKERLVEWTKVYTVPKWSDLTSDEVLEREWRRLSKFLENVAPRVAPLRESKRGAWAEWWTPEVKDAVKAARAAERRWKAYRSQLHHEELEAALKAKKKTIDFAKARTWRNLTQGISVSRDGSKQLWALERWARLRSHAPPDPPRIPELKVQAGLACTHAEKTEALASQFFPRTFSQGFPVEKPWRNDDSELPEELWQVTEEDVRETLKKTSPWKAPGADGLPAGYLKACHGRIHKTLAVLISATLKRGYFPSCFKKGTVIVLRKPGKTMDEMREPGSWRPITLLCHMGKLIEAIVAKRLTDLAEMHGWLPEAQMGNRKGKNTEFAVRVVTDLVTEIWRRKGAASMLLLDLKGAFDRVNHHALLRTLWEKGVPPGLIKFIESFLSGRTSKLHFDNKDSDFVPVQSGVPQGSPLSPILFILFIATLYEELKQVQKTTVVGFADDTNILAFGRTTDETVETLQSAWTICEEWANRRGMIFLPAKTNLIHFSRKRKLPKKEIRLGDLVRPPKVFVRFLGVWLDHKLRWGSHGDQLLKKMKTQQYALTKIAAKTWGINFERSREVYTKCLRSAMVYGAASWHTLTDPGKGPKGVAKRLMKVQNEALRVVSGAFKATPTRDLETETFCPPLDLVLNERVAMFQERLLGTSTHRHIISETSRIDKLLARKKGRGRPRKRAPTFPEHTDAKEMWRTKWLGECTNPSDALLRDWKARWAKDQNAGFRGRPKRATDNPTFDPSTIALRTGMTKAESSVLMQARTEKIGLRAFLFTRKVPEITTPYCDCGGGRERLVHLALHCPRERDRFEELFPDIRNSEDLRDALSSPKEAKAIAQWILSTGRLGMYRLYSKVMEENLSRDEVVATTKPPKAKKRKKDQPDHQPGHKPQRFLTEMWTERMVPGFAHTSVQLPEYAWGKEAIGWEVVAANYGPPKHGNRGFQKGHNVGNPIVVL